MLRRQLMAAALVVLPTFYPLDSIAQSIQQRQNTRASNSPSIKPEGKFAGEPAGILTSRLSAKDLDRWKSIEQVIFAEGANYQPLHPTLVGMWQWIETSGHTIYIEIIRNSQASSSTAGNFSIERHDSRGEHQVGVIRLNLSNIDQAYVGPSAARENGFVPFDGLSKVERYVEVLGHELAHAVDILTSPERAKNVEYMIEETNELLLKSTPRRKYDSISPDLRKRLSRRDILLQELEHRAEAMEHAVWKELIKSKSSHEKSNEMAAGR